MGLRVPPLRIKIILESNPPKSRILVGRLAVPGLQRHLREDQEVVPQAARLRRPRRRTARGEIKQYIYIYIEREREKERDTCVYM